MRRTGSVGRISGLLFGAIVALSVTNCGGGDTDLFDPIAGRSSGGGAAIAGSGAQGGNGASGGSAGSSGTESAGTSMGGNAGAAAMGGNAGIGGTAGSAGTAGSSGSQPMCTEGEPCGADCVDTMTDVAHCGGCDQPCPEDAECDKGECACLEELEMCDEACVDTQ